MKKVTSWSTKTKHTRERQTNTPHKSSRTSFWKRTHPKKGMRCEPRALVARVHRTKQTEKGKRKSEKHEALCEVRAPKNKKEKQTQKHNQQKHKRHRETLRKKVENTVELN
jgi:hypothetical protein